MKNLCISLRRGLVMFQIRALETTLAGQNEVLDQVTDKTARRRIEAAREEARNELVKARSAYNALLPVGKRRIWDVA